jgi:hypothetical protein
MTFPADEVTDEAIRGLLARSSGEDRVQCAIALGYECGATNAEVSDARRWCMDRLLESIGGAPACADNDGVCPRDGSLCDGTRCD